MKSWLPTTALMLALCLSGPTRAADPYENLDNWTNDCRGEPGAAVIVACTKAISSGQLQGEELAHMLRDRAESYIHEKQFDLAIADCNRALTLVPDSSDLLFFRAKAFDGAGKTDEAVADFNHLVEQEPNQYVVFEARAVAYADAKKYDRALADFDHALKLAPGMPKVVLERIITTMAMGRFDLAMPALDGEIKKYPHNGYFVALRGTAYREWTAGPSDRLALARSDFTRGAELYEAEGNRAAAVALRSQASALDPTVK